MSGSGAGKGEQVLGRAPSHGIWHKGRRDVSLPTPWGRLDYVMASWGRDLLPCREGRSVSVCMPAPLWEECTDREEFPGLSSQCPWPTAQPLPQMPVILGQLLWG